jgi:hypothetical protein
VKMYGKLESNDKMHVYKNGDEKAPYLYFNKLGGLGIWDGTKSPIYFDDSGNFSMFGNLILDGSNKWIFHTPDDGRTAMQIAPWKGSDWDWNNSTNFNNNGTITNTNINGLAGFIFNGGSEFVPFSIGEQGNLRSIGISVNVEDGVILAPKCGLKLWDRADPPDYNSEGTWKAENTTSTWKFYGMWGSNRMDFFKAYKL